MIKILNEINFLKELKGLKKYFMKAYKQFIFEVIPEIKKQTKRDGYYYTTLDIDDVFNKIYGELRINYIVKNGIAYIENFEPQKMLLDMYFGLLPTYKGIPYRNQRDLFKIKILKG